MNIFSFIFFLLKKSLKIWIRNKWAHFIKMSTKETHRSIETIDQICKVLFLSIMKVQQPPPQKANTNIRSQQLPNYEDFYMDSDNYNSISNFQNQQQFQLPNQIQNQENPEQKIEKIFDDETYENFKKDSLKALKDLRNIQNYLVKQRAHEISSEEKQKTLEQQREKLKMDIEEDN